MMSAFSVLFGFALVSIVFHRTKYLQPFALLAIVVSALFTYVDASQIQLFEFVLEFVLFAFLLHEKEETTQTQTLFLGASSLLLLEAKSVLDFLIAFEALSIISVVVVSFIQTKEQAEGAIKMFIAGSIATGILFLGVVFYVMGGGVLLAPLAHDGTFFMSVGSFVMLAGVFYKLTIVPFHGWAIDSYALMRHTHAGLLSGVAKTVVALSVFKIFSPFLLEHLQLSVPLLATLAIVTMTVGNFLALFSTKIARILSFSSIAHAGYILVAFVAVKSSYADEGILYMAIAYIFMQSGAFLALDILRKEYGIVTLEDIKGLASYNPLIAALFTLQLLSLAGIPLLAGFLAKAVVFYAGVDAGLWWLVLVALLNSALSVGYYAWIVKHIYFDATTKERVQTKTEYLKMASQILLAGATVVFGLFAGLVFG